MTVENTPEGKPIAFRNRDNRDRRKGAPSNPDEAALFTDLAGDKRKHMRRRLVTDVDTSAELSEEYANIMEKIRHALHSDSQEFKVVQALMDHRDYYEVVGKTQILGVKHEDIAATIGMTRTTFDTTLIHARNHLKDTFPELEERLKDMLSNRPTAAR